MLQTKYVGLRGQQKSSRTIKCSCRCQKITPRKSHRTKLHTKTEPMTLALNSSFRILCRNTSIASRAPPAPPIQERVRSRLSGILQAPQIAFTLSTPNLTYPVASHGGSHARDSGWKMLVFHTEVFRVVLTDKPLWDRYLLRSQPSKPLTSQLRADRYFTGFNSFSVSRTGRQVKRPAMVKAERLHCFIQLNAGITNR